MPVILFPDPFFFKQGQQGTKGVRSGAKVLGFQTQPYHLLAVLPEVTYPLCGSSIKLKYNGHSLAGKIKSVNKLTVI